MRISDWSSDVCSSDLGHDAVQDVGAGVDTEDVVVQIDVGAGLAVDGVNLDLHDQDSCAPSVVAVSTTVSSTRSEEHTSELQSLMRISYAVFCLKKKTHKPST